MKTHDREILIYYNSASSADKKTIAHAQGLAKHVTKYDYKDVSATSTSWKRILSSLNRHPKELMNKAHPYYQKHIRGREFDHEGWLNVIARNPELMRSPIAIKGRKVVLCENPTDVYKLIDNKNPRKAPNL